MSARRLVALLSAAALAACTGTAPAGPGRTTTASAPSQGRTPAQTPAQPTTPPADAAVDVALLTVRASATTAYVVRTENSGSTSARTTVLRTTDAGRTFSPATSPAPTAGDVDLVFPAPATGYALIRAQDDSTRLLVTTDGARTWRPVHVPTTDAVIHLAGHGSRVFAVTTRCHDTTCDRVRLWTARTGGAVLHAAAALPRRDASSGVSLAAWDDTVWVGLGSDGPHPVLVRSTDAGATLHRLPGLVVLACGTTASSAHVVWSACRTGMLMAFSRSVDGRERPLPLEAAGTTGAFLQPVSDDVAWFGVGLGDEPGRWPAGLYRTTDGGRHFTRVSPGPPGYSPSTSVTFLDAEHALAADGDRLQRTADGTRTWQPVAL